MNRSAPCPALQRLGFKAPFPASLRWLAPRTRCVATGYRVGRCPRVGVCWLGYVAGAQLAANHARCPVLWNARSKPSLARELREVVGRGGGGMQCGHTSTDTVV